MKFANGTVSRICAVLIACMGSTQSVRSEEAVKPPAVVPQKTNNAKAGQSVPATELARRYFLKGMKERDAGNFKEACMYFGQSYTTEPGIKATFQLANCLEEQGQTRRAQRLFEVVATMAKRDGDAEGAAIALERAKIAEKHHSTIVINVPEKAEQIRHLSIFLDDELIPPSNWNRTRNIVDSGKHTIRASAPGHRPHTVGVVIEKFATARHVDIPVLKPESVTFAAPVKDKRAPDLGIPTKELVLLVGGGLVFLGGGVSFAKSRAPSKSAPTDDTLEDAGLVAMTAGLVGLTWGIHSLVTHKPPTTTATFTPWITPTSASVFMTQPF